MMNSNKIVTLTETSAKKHDGVDTVFTVLVDQILQRPQVLLSRSRLSPKSKRLKEIKKNLKSAPLNVYPHFTFLSFGSVSLRLEMREVSLAWASEVTWGPGPGRSWAAAPSRRTQNCATCLE